MFYVVSTPIGNMGDITYRAVEILKKVHFILAEDTRVSKMLAKKYGITTQMISYRDQNHNAIVTKIKEKLDMKLDIALISDAGTPTLSDPGYKLIEELVKNDYLVISIPGAFAGVAALSISGLPTDKFAFLGFLPKSDSQRKKILEKYLNLDSTIIIYESPNRIEKLINEILDVVKSLTPKNKTDDRLINIANDLTKMYEFSLTSNLSNIKEKLAKKFPDGYKGEFVVSVAKSTIN